MGCIERGVQLNIFGLFAVPFLGHLKATDLGLTWHFHAPIAIHCHFDVYFVPCGLYSSIYLRPWLRKIQGEAQRDSPGGKSM